MNEKLPALMKADNKANEYAVYFKSVQQFLFFARANQNATWGCYLRWADKSWWWKWNASAVLFRNN